MYRWLIIFAFCLTAEPFHAQQGNLAETEDSLFRLFSRFPLMGSVEEMHELNESIIAYMQESLAGAGSFDYAFDSLRKRAGILTPDDRKFRIITWNVPLNEWEHEYYGIIQVPDMRTGVCRIYVLNNKFKDIPDLLKAETDHNMWPGALYYDIRRNKDSREVIYTLIGFNFHDRWSDKKVIEILHFGRDGEPVFGRPVFSTPDGVQHRVVFEYSGEVAMNLRYNPDMKMIVYDHLSPIEPELAGHPRFYAPDFSYDGYKFRKGMWVHQSDIDVRNR